MTILSVMIAMLIMIIIMFMINPISACIFHQILMMKMMMDGVSGTWFKQSSRLVPFVEVACQSYLSQFYTLFNRICQTFTSLCHEQTPATEEILLLDLPCLVTADLIIVQA